MKKLAAKFFMTLVTVSSLSTLALGNVNIAYLPGPTLDSVRFFTLYTAFDRFIGHLLIGPLGKAAKR